MSVQPISEVRFQIKKSALNKEGSLVALDKGCSLTKIAYVTKEDIDKSTDYYLMRCVLFENNQLEKALDWIKLNAFLPEGKSIRLSGAGVHEIKEKVQVKLNRETMLVKGFFNPAEGLKIMVNTVAVEDRCFELVEKEVEEIKKFIIPALVQKSIEKEKSTFDLSTNGSNKWPAICGLFGSGAMKFIVDERESVNKSFPAGFGEDSFLGLAKMLLGTSNYEEVMSLAARGNERNVDTVISEVVMVDSDSPYGDMPLDLPVLSFGKPIHYEKNISEYKREDLAASLLALTGATIANEMNLIVRFSKIRTVYLVGDIFRNELMRQSVERFRKLHSVWFYDGDPTFHYFKTGLIELTHSLTS